ncbi:MAG TPA: heavy-metal-associated domain-containing protein [Clostridiales bacterium]|jgi:Cu+-exporting ATPase|nr:heavy-metal-associated domain-containing protein [Clostridiales bacterium]
MFGKTVEYEFAVGGMSCGHCEASVERALRGVKGVKSAVVDLEGGLVKVTAKVSVDSESLRQAVRDAGYDVN